MQETSPVGNGPATDSDSATVEQTVSTPTTALGPTKVPAQNTTGTPAPGIPAPGVPASNDPAPNDPAPDRSAPAPNSQQFPPTLVGLDPPTLPAAEGMRPPHREVDARGPADLPQFRPFPHPQRSEPGHPGLRRMWRRLLTFWRRTSI